MPFMNNDMLMISGASPQLTAPNECNYEWDRISVDAAFDFDFDFCSSSSSSSAPTSASTPRSESPDTLPNELSHDALSGQHLHHYRSRELAPYSPSQASSSVHVHPLVRTRSLTLPATTSTTRVSRAASQPASAIAAPLRPSAPTPASTTDAPPLTRTIYKKPCSYDLRSEFLHAAPAARAALARQIFHAPLPSQPSPQAFTSMPGPHVAASDVAAPRRIQGG